MWQDKSQPNYHQRQGMVCTYFKQYSARLLVNRSNTTNVSNFWKFSCSNLWKQTDLLQYLALIAMNKFFLMRYLGCWSDLSIWKSQSWLMTTSQKWWYGLISSYKHTKRKRSTQTVKPRLIPLMPFLPIKPHLIHQTIKWNCTNQWLICQKSFLVLNLTTTIQLLPQKTLLGRIPQKIKQMFFKM